MNWFESQIRHRRIMDDSEFSDSFTELAQAVVQTNNAKYQSKERIAMMAINEMLHYFKKPTVKLPQNIRSYPDMLDYACRAHGVLKRRVTLDGEWYNSACGIMIAELERGGSPVALIPGKLFGYSYFDFESGKYVRVTKKNVHKFKSEATVFFKPFPKGKISLWDFICYTLSFITLPEIMIWILLAFFAVDLTLLLPDIVKNLFGKIIYYGNNYLMYSLVFMMVSATVSSFILRKLKDFVSGRVSIRMSMGVRTAAMMRVMSLPTSFFKDYSAGDLASRLDLLKPFCDIILVTFSNTIFVLFYALLNIGQWTYYGSSFVAFTTSFFVIICIWYLIPLNNMTMQNIKKLKKETQASGVTYEMITGIQKIKLTGSEKRFFSRWSKVYADAARVKYSPPPKIIFIKAMPAMITFIAMLLLYFISEAFHIPTATYYAVSMWTGFFVGSVVDLFDSLPLTATIGPIIRLLEPIFACEPENDFGKNTLTNFSGGIEFSNVYFRYDESTPYVLDNFNLRINNGEYVAVVGKTGCGKSTLVRLLTGFEKPTKGAVYISGIDIETLDHKALRRKIGIVAQSSRLFQGDILSNITISAPKATWKDAWSAAEMAGIANDIRAMPMGMHTLISAGGRELSGGQRQRIAITRALLQNPKILILDEATSALDNTTQRKIADTLDSLKCTRIVIAHRLSTIKNCNRIIVIDGGRVVETGSYDELISKNGIFADLVAHQQLSDDTSGEVKP